MNAEDVREIRAALGLDQTQLAHALGFEGPNARKTIQRAEAGQVPLSGPAQLALTYLAQGALDEKSRQIIPEWVIGGSHDGGGPELIMHMVRPRFVGVIFEQPVTGLDHIEVSDGEWINIAMWIDNPAGFDVDHIMRAAAAAFEIYTQDSFEANIQ